MFLSTFCRITTIIKVLSSFQSSNAGFLQGSEEAYLSRFDSIVSQSYSAVDDNDNINRPQGLLNQCKQTVDHLSSPATFLPLMSETTVTPQDADNIVESSLVSNQCDANTICIIPAGVTVVMNSNLNVGALIVRGIFQWYDVDPSPSSTTDAFFLCAGYVAVEESGQFRMNLQSNDGWLYIKNNGATHPVLRNRSFGAVAGGNGEPVVDIVGRHIKRSWSLLSDPMNIGSNQMKLLHDPLLMGWRIGDRVGIATTQVRSTGSAQSFRIVDIQDNGLIILDSVASDDYQAEFVSRQSIHATAALMSAEVSNLSRNIVITGDDFHHVSCDPNLPEAVPGEESSVLGCRCSSYRSICTIGLHTMHSLPGGVTRIENTRIEKCGQRGVEGKYCLHFHKVGDCPECLYRNNVIENSHQRGIIVHGTHRSTIEANVLYDVRGAGIYIEDANEMWNKIMYNVITCPWPLNDPTMNGCTIPGASNLQADTEVNQAGIFTLSATNDLIGNRVSNSFNGMLLQAGGIGRGTSYGKVCTSDALFGRFEGNTFHSHGRFGTYTLGSNYPKLTDRSIESNGHNIDMSLCEGFTSDGSDRGLPVAFTNVVDYGNAFVGHYNAGDIQYSSHTSINNINLLYWKETKNFADGCSAHISHSYYEKGNMALPDQATFIIEHTVFGQDIRLEANHHCNIGTTGVLCMPTYVLHNIEWRGSHAGNWLWFFSENTQNHNRNQNHGGIFVLSPESAAASILADQNGETLENSIFPPGFVSLVSSKFSFLLSAPNGLCVESFSLGYEFAVRYDYGILCKVPLRALKIYTRNYASVDAPALLVQTWFNNLGLVGQEGDADASQEIQFHQVGGDGDSLKQGYSLPVIPGLSQSYRLSLVTSDGNVPNDFVVEFSDPIIGNRWDEEYIVLSLQGRDCGENGLVSSQHDRKFLWSGDSFMSDAAWGNHGACTGAPDMDPVVCADNDPGRLGATECQDLCSSNCDPATSFCDCGTGQCTCKPGFTGVDCSIDLCAAARCGPHGTCSAQYLGSDLPVTSDQACICDEGWSGPLCTYNPCIEQNRDCSGHGRCAALGDSDTVCICEDGWSGVDCEDTCDGYCQGTYPYGCADYGVDGAVKYQCNQFGGCFYPGVGESSPSEFCTYKVENEGGACECKSATDCMISGPCLSDGSCPDLVAVDDGTPCNSIPYGLCQDGVCAESLSPTTARPTKISQNSPTLYPTKIVPTSLPSSLPTQNLLTPLPTLMPTSSPTFPCGCQACSDEVWNTLACNDTLGGCHTCGARISFLTLNGNTEEDACILVGEVEFPIECGNCGPQTCGENKVSTVPTASSSVSPSMVPSSVPTLSFSTVPSRERSASPSTRSSSLPSLTPSQMPTILPTSSTSSNPKLAPTVSPTSGSYHCGCNTCTDEIWETVACDDALDGCYSCGARIAWLVSIGNTEEDACILVGDEEFPDECPCGPTTCKGSMSYSPSIDPSTSPTVLPTGAPTPEPNSAPCTAKGEDNYITGSYIPCCDGLVSCNKDWFLADRWHYRCADSCEDTAAPTPYPTVATTTIGQRYCRCESCTDEVWNRVACSDAFGGCYTCGSRISFLSSNGNTGEEACEIVGGQQFPFECGVCDPKSCSTPPPTPGTTDAPAPEPTEIPTATPTALPTAAPTEAPTPAPIAGGAPTSSPDSSRFGPYYCSCEACDSSKWNADACDDNGDCYTCGDRISWLMSSEGGSKTEEYSCGLVSNEFPDVCGSCNPILCNPVYVPEPNPDELVWSDEFNSGSVPDSNKWNYDLGGDGWGNGELQYYTSRVDNAYISGGALHIRAVKESFASNQYTSARLVSKFKGDWLYGRVLVRAKLEHCVGRGTWPAIWMLPTDWCYGGWPRSGEIDIMEHVGYDVGRVHGTVHTEAYHHSIGTQVGSSVPLDVAEYHVYEIIWSPNKIEFVVDSMKYHEFVKDSTPTIEEWPFDQRFHLLLNVAVGGAWGGVEGVDSTVFEGGGQIMDIDWVRIYSNTTEAPTTCEATLVPTPPPPSASSLTVVTQNLFWWNLFDIQNGGNFFNVFRGYGPYDIFLFQECRDVDYIMQGLGYSNPKTYQGPHDVSLAWDGDRFSLLENGWEIVGEDQPGLWGERCVVYARLFDTQTGKNIFVANHHGPLPVNTGGNTGGLAVAQAIHNVINANKLPNDIVVLGGDFNADISSETIVSLQQNHGYRLQASDWVDHVFTSGTALDETPSQTTIIQNTGSDHRGIKLTWNSL